MMFSKWFLLALASWCGLVTGQREPGRFYMKAAEAEEYGFYVVGISDHGHFARTGENKRVCAGIIIKLDLVLTAAAPMRQYDRPEGAHDLKVGYYHPDKGYLRYLCLWTQVRYIKFHEDNRDMYSSIDPFRTNADMAMLLLTEDMNGYGLSWTKWPAAIPAVITTEYIKEGELLQDYTMKHFSFCTSYGSVVGDYRVLTSYFIDSPARQRYYREKYIPPSRIVDCNQLFIEGWGKFICIRVWGRGCDSGSALVKYGYMSYYYYRGERIPYAFYDLPYGGKREVLGMCSFSITVEGRTYMIFTDFTKSEHKDFISTSIATKKEWI